MPKAAYITIGSLLTAPLRITERLAYGATIARTEITKDPVFILGHWRTGTTFLHNLLCQDPQFGFLSTFLTVAPEFSLVSERWLKPALGLLLPDHRPQDNIALNPDLPQEEELAMPPMCPYTMYAGYHFPAQFRSYFTRFVLFEGIPEGERQAWRNAYHWLLRKATYCAQGRQLVLKSPTNTGRIPELLALYPNARFIHIYRNPYVLYGSTLRLYAKMLQVSALQRYTQEEIEENVFVFFERMMRKYLKDRTQIPDERLVELRFETFEQDPLNGLREAYKVLGLDGFDAAMPRLNAYLDSVRGYRKNRYRLDQITVDRIRERWGFALEAWNYDVPDDLDII